MLNYKKIEAIFHCSLSTLIVISCLYSCTGTEDLSSSQNEDKIFGDYSDDSYYHSSEDYFADDDEGWSTTGDDQALIDEFLSYDLGEPQYGDLTDGEILVAGPALGVEVVIGCSEGALYVAAGSATGALATVFAASGVLAGGVGVGATATASVPLYAAAGGLIGMAASSASWGQCFGGLANLGLNLIQQGYFSAARGMQSVLRRPTRSTSMSGATSASAECRGGGSKCRQMNNRYHSFCDPLETATQLLTNRWDGGLCTNADRYFRNYSCNDLSSMVKNAAGCEAGRRLVTDRCYGGNWDRNHIPPWRNAQNQLRNCSNLFRQRCGSLPSGDQIRSEAENQYPECR